MKKPKRKKLVLAAVALVLVAAIGAGIWFGVGGGSEPVNVYPFDNLGMTEYWGDSQECYGPVSTDKIQTVYLSDTQTVTEVLVSEGDEVKEGDVLMTFDTTLTELELERKRLDVERQKIDLQDAQTELRKIRNMTPMDPDALNITIPETEPVLGDLLTELYKLSENPEYDGSSVEKALICWLQDGQPINDPLLRAAYLQAMTYQADNASKQSSSASGFPEDNTESKEPAAAPTESTAAPTESTAAPTEPIAEPTEPAAEPTEPTEEPVVNVYSETAEETIFPVNVSYRIGGDEVFQEILYVDQYNSVTLKNVYDYNNLTYWLDSAVRNSDSAELLSLRIPAFPVNDADEQEAWKSVWGKGVTLNYIRSTEIKSDQVMENSTLQVEAGKETVLCFSAYMEDVPSGGDWSWTVTPSEGENVLKAAPNGNFLILSGTPEATDQPVEYKVTVTYSFCDNTGSERAVKEEFSFSIKAVENSDPGDSIADFYMILKVTEDNRERGAYLTWQGLHVYCYKDGSYGMTLFDASSLEDHTLEELEEEEIELPDIDFGSGYTAAEIAQMRSEQEKKVKELDLALRLAQAELNIMQAEVNDGKVCANFDGQVVSVLTEDEARQDSRPLLKVSAGGGFYVEGSVSELEKDNLEIGQDVTVEDWNTGMTYTGTVESIGDFPTTNSYYYGIGNFNASYYPFTVFIDGSADLQADNYVSITYSTAPGGNGVYLRTAFIRTEQGKSYVYVEGEDGKLEKRYVTVGKSLWGSYLQVLSGLTEEDYIAFPYGKTVKEGAPAVETDDLSSLYSY